MACAAAFGFGVNNGADVNRHAISRIELKALYRFLA